MNSLAVFPNSLSVLGEYDLASGVAPSSQRIFLQRFLWLQQSFENLTSDPVPGNHLTERKRTRIFLARIFCMSTSKAIATGFFGCLPELRNMSFSLTKMVAY